MSEKKVRHILGLSGGKDSTALALYLKNEIQDVAIPNIEMIELSMGMTGDFETAIAEGATLVRIGTAIFGERA